MAEAVDVWDVGAASIVWGTLKVTAGLPVDQQPPGQPLHLPLSKSG
jgi:hypothetical protein